MTEELKKEAEEKSSVYFNSLDIDNGNVSDTPFSAYDVFVAYKKGALEFAEPREKRIEELEAQIEKMKCCENCGKEFTKECAWWKRAEENRQINTCKDWEIKEK